MTLSIRGMGTASPTYSIDQGDAAEIAKTFVCDHADSEQVLPKLFKMSQVRRRGSVVLDQPNGSGPRQSFYPSATSSKDRGPRTETRMRRFAGEAAPLALQASQRALETSDVAAEEITHIVTVSCTGFSAPGVDITLIKRLGLSPSVGRVHVGFMGCHAAVNALRVAKALVDADTNARVLVCCVELCSLHYSYGWDPERVVANSLFADGAAAVIAAPVETSSNGADRPFWSVAATGSCVLPDSEHEMAWEIGDHGFELRLSPRVPEVIRSELRPWLCQWLSSQGLKLEDVKSWAIHPGGPRIIRSATQALDLPRDATEASMQVLSEHGNMSSATVLFVLQKLWQRRAKPPCVALAFGPGLVAEAALFV